MSGGRIRSIRFKDGFTVDSLTNAVSGFGTHADPRTYNRYLPRNLDQFHIAAAYDGSGMMAKVIDIPALDMVREWRNWQADAKQIKALEAEERRLGLREKVRMAETYRGLGGGALVIITAGDHASELKPEQIAKGGIVAINVVTRWQITGVDYIDEIADPNYGKPTYWRMGNSQANIHPSRVICFRGDPVPPILPVSADERFWGRARVQRVLDAVQNVDTAQGSFASLITKVRNVIIGIPGLMDLVSDADGEAALRRRLSAMILGESMYNAMLRDAGDGTPGAGETIDHRQVNWAGIPDVMMAFATFLSAVSDIPATRLMGKSPDGQNATGDSDTANWNRMVKAKQTLELQPCMDQLDPLLMASAGVMATDDAEVWADWAPLDTPSEKEEADTFNVTMDAVAKLQATGAIPDEAFAKGLQNLMTERGWIPGLEGALAEIPENERFGLNPDDDGTDPSAIQAEGGDPNLAGGGSSAPARRAAVNDAAAFFVDAAPRPLYVQRKLLNGAALIAWAKANGFKSTLAADDLHVTVLYSKTAVDPMKMGESWSGDENGNIRVKPGGPRAIERFGENAVVLLFASWELESRHRSMVDAGGSHDFDEYHPHVTISFDVPDAFDLAALKPYAGALEFGPELFEPLNLDWKRKVTEE
ncbi:anti-CBASS protein Acb1 family protein [Novosphingobium sp. KA1]|uniref:phage portal protein n=1 Tax=Novosphingobium sp. (strain KA1) TaxID=164608 RepID=UPI001A8CD3B5|nr:anti-CBASS Acb1 family protein [Novosphingobium sp. KA1]QSR18420.1 portal protein [Novosphingobium sp. KA1]